MTEPINPPDGPVAAKYKTIISSAGYGRIRVSLPGRLNMTVWSDRRIFDSAMTALQNAAKPDFVLRRYFPDWENMEWVDPGLYALTPGEIQASTELRHIALSAPQGVTLTREEMVEVFLDWLRTTEPKSTAIETADTCDSSPSFPMHLLGFAGTAVAVSLLAYGVLVNVRPSPVVKQESIGAFVTAHGANTWSYPWALETQRGVYPVSKAMMIDRGAALVLVTRSNGKQTVCSAGLETCVATVATDRWIRGDEKAD